jgi:MarR family 2-MHQ and catechol resistance regulon transcriptional repressor
VPTLYPNSPADVIALDAFIELTRAVESVHARLARRNTISGLTASQFSVLESLYHLGSMGQGDLRAKLLRSGGDITLVMDSLAKRGLARRERSTKDRRVVDVSLTAAGMALIEQVFPGHVAAILEEMGALRPRSNRRSTACVANLAKERPRGKGQNDQQE